jgi:hypothetical protein
MLRPTIQLSFWQLHPVAKVVLGSVDVIYQVISEDIGKQDAYVLTQILQKQAEAHEALLDLVDSVLDASSCATQVRCYKTSDQLKNRLQELRTLVGEASDIVNKHYNRSGLKGASCSSVVQCSQC